MMTSIRGTTRRVLVLLSAMCLLGTAVGAQTAKPITKSGLIKAIQIGGLSSRELIQQIKTRGVAFPLTPEVEAELKSAGASAEVMEAVRSHTPSPTPSATPVVRSPVSPITNEITPPRTIPAPPSRTAITKPGIYVKKAGQWADVLPEGVNWKKTGNIKKFTIGLGKGEMVGSIPGSASPNAFKDPVTFLICTPEGASASDYQLILLREHKGIREVKVGSSGSDSRNLVQFTPRKIADRNYVVEFSQGAGDYGFLPPALNVADGALPVSSRMYTFRVD